MRPELIDPFIDGVKELFETMLGGSAEVVEMGTVTRTDPPEALTALIGLSGRLKGSVALGLPESTAVEMARRLMGMDDVADMVDDAMAEMVNIVGGGAKAKLSEKIGGDPMQLSLPTMIRGNNFEIQYPSGSIWTEVGFSSDCGPFRLCVTFAGDTSFKGA
ncbi:MAG: chemotaxis protein CheX [Lentisphaeria bacterium]|nr:chemotaxis protein CheX [Lentisphaeria bacterium]